VATANATAATAATDATMPALHRASFAAKPTTSTAQSATAGGSHAAQAVARGVWLVVDGCVPAVSKWE
jgi:hypothetical protein